MGGIEVGLKQGSFRGLGLGLKQSIQQQEQSHYNARNAVVLDSGDYSFADQFLNLQTATDSNIQQEDLQVDHKDSVFLPPPPQPLRTTQTEVDFCSALTLPEEEGELEWLSQFMEDSFSQPYLESPNPNKKRKGRAGPTPGRAKVARTCSHCGTQKTPQWRVGPTGEKTLCNACGMRFKTGRLLPEYRPANSPTFSEEIHASSHKKVLEMRKKNKP